MILLLDTHVALWYVTGDHRLSAHARSLIEDKSNAKLFSVASVWEIAIKTSLGKLKIQEPLDVVLDKAARAIGYDYLDISVQHACRVSGLPFHHRDPFDRLLASQCQCDTLPIVSADALFDPYGIQRIWKGSAD